MKSKLEADIQLKIWKASFKNIFFTQNKAWTFHFSNKNQQPLLSRANLDHYYIFLIISNILSTINNVQESLHLKKIFLFFGKSKLKARLKQAQSKIIPSSKSKIKASSKQAPSVPWSCFELAFQDQSKLKASFF